MRGAFPDYVNRIVDDLGPLDATTHDLLATALRPSTASSSKRSAGLATSPAAATLADPTEDTREARPAHRPAPVRRRPAA